MSNLDCLALTPELKTEKDVRVVWAFAELFKDIKVSEGVIVQCRWLLERNNWKKVSVIECLGQFLDEVKTKLEPNFAINLKKEKYESLYLYSTSNHVAAAFILMAKYDEDDVQDKIVQLGSRYFNLSEKQDIPSRRDATAIVFGMESCVTALSPNENAKITIFVEDAEITRYFTESLNPLYLDCLENIKHEFVIVPATSEFKRPAAFLLHSRQPKVTSR